MRIKGVWRGGRNLVPPYEDFKDQQAKREEVRVRQARIKDLRETARLLRESREYPARRY